MLGLASYAFANGNSDARAIVHVIERFMKNPVPVLV
jgi:hypothetical protein